MRTLKASIRLYIFLVPLLMVFFIETAFAYPEENADSWDYAFPTGEKCFKPGSGETPVGQIDGNFCMANALDAANTEMNTTYKKMLSVLIEGKMLRESQRAWLKFRSLECKLRTSGMGEGSATQYFVDSCNLDLTLKELKTSIILTQGLTATVVLYVNKQA